MNLLGFAALLGVTLAWTALPLIPALRELWAPSDVDPLRMVGRDNTDISRFARNFREYMQRNLERLPPDAAVGDYFGRLPDGTHFVRVSRLLGVLDRGAVPDGSHDRVVILEQDVELNGHERFRLELWARGNLRGGPGAEYRAILGEGTVSLAAESVVWRWVHSNGLLRVKDGCALFGRTSSDTSVWLGRDVGFERVGAPWIVAGERAAPAAAEIPTDLIPFQPPAEAEVRGDHLRVEGDLTLPPRSVWHGNLVVTGTLRVGVGSVVRGSVKAHESVEIEAGGRVTGSVVSRRGVRTAESVWLHGPVIAEGEIILGPGSTVGSPEHPTTVSGESVVLALEAAVCGHLLAVRGGRTES